MAKKSDKGKVKTSLPDDLELLMEQLVSTILEGMEIKTQEDYQDNESKVLGELEDLKDSLDDYLLGAIDNLPSIEDDFDLVDNDELNLNDLEDE